MPIYHYVSFVSGVCRFPSAIGSDWNFHARKNPNPEDLSDPNFPGPFVAEDPRECGHGSVPSV